MSSCHGVGKSEGWDRKGIAFNGQPERGGTLLADEFAPDRPVYAIFVKDELQMVEESINAGQTETDFPELAAKYLAVIRQRQSMGPNHLLGLSFGGTLAYEIAQQLFQLGEDVGLLATPDRNLPGEARSHLRFRIARKLRKIPRSLASSEMGDAQYLDATRFYSADPYCGKAIFAKATLAGAYTSYGRAQLLPGAEFFSIATDHLGLLKPPATRQLAALMKRELGQEL